jgi:hypothetical protein
VKKRCLPVRTRQGKRGDKGKGLGQEGEEAVEAGCVAATPPGPVKNLFMGNMTQIYPEDRGMNYAVQLGWRLRGRLSEKGIEMVRVVGGGFGRVTRYGG